MAQITSVSQLSDIKPTDWAFQSLQSLIERYGCISGYPDKTYRGNRALTRYEFAAELAVIRGRVDRLDTQTATLEKQQFSTTTKLQGQTIFAINGSNAPNPNPTFLHRSRLSLTSSFSGKDLLLIQLQAGTPNADATSVAQSENQGFKNRLATIGEAQIQTQFERIFFPLSTLGVTLEDLGIGLKNLPTVDAVQEKALGTIATLSLEEGIPPETVLTLRQTLSQNIENARSTNRFLQASSSLNYTQNLTRNLSLNRLSYQVPLSPDLQLAIFPQGYLSDHIDTNRYANNKPYSFSTYGLVNNQLLLANDTPGAGAAIHWHPGQQWIKFNLAYRAEQTALNSTPSIFTNTTATNLNSGIFTAPNLAVFEIELTPSKATALRLQYSTGTQAGQAYRVLGTNLELALGKQIGIFGRFGYAPDFPGDVNPISWSTGLVISDLFKPGARAGISVGQPLIFEDKTLGLFKETQTNYEAFYHYPINDRIAISPAIQVIVSPGNASGNTIVTGTLRTTFSF